MKNIFALSLFLTMNLAIVAQPTLIGARVAFSGGTEIVRWHALDSTTIENFQTDLLGYLLSSSVFDSYNGNYYLEGINALGYCLFSFNSPTNEMNSIPFSATSNISEIDMSNGSIYTITIDSTGTFIVNQLDLITGNTSLLGVVDDPGISGMVVDATAFDSEHGILFTEVEDYSGSLSLCRIFVRNPVFSYDLIPIQLPNPQCNFSCFQYDNLNNILFALKMDNSTGGGVASIAQINDSTGAVNEIGLIPQIIGIVAGSSSFDQETGSFLIVGVDSLNEYVQVLYNTITLSCTTGFVPDGISEVVCDNYDWAKSHYGVNALDRKPVSDEIIISPVPCTNQFTIRLNNTNTPLNIRLTDLQGRCCLDMDYPSSPAVVSAASLVPGMYLVTIFSGENVYTGKVVIGR